MKTKLLFIALIILLNFRMYSQVPSINQSGNVSKTSAIINFETTLSSKMKELKILKKKQSDKTDTKELSNSISNKQSEIDAIQTQITAENDKDPSIVNCKKHYDLLISKKQEEINKLNDDAAAAAGGDTDPFNSIQDNIKIKQGELNSLKDEKEAAIASINGHYKALFPSVDRLHRNQFFKSMYNKKNDNTKYVNSFALSSNKDGSLAQSEIITDNLSALRLSFGSIISSPSGTPTNPTDSQNQTEAEAVKRLIGGGGNLYLEVDFPLLSTNNENKGWFAFYSYANLIGASDIKGFGNNLPTSSGNGSFGISNYLGATSDNGKFNFFIQGNINYTMGSNDFYNNLGLDNEKGFLNGKLIAGVTLLNTFRFSAILSTYGSDEKVRSGNVILGIQILPNL